MPLLRISYPRGAMTVAHKTQLAAELTDIVLEAEVDAVTETGRMVTLIQFHEHAAEDWAVAGKLRSATERPPDHYLVDVIVLEGLLEGARRGAVHARVTDAFKRAFGDSDPTLPLRVWVLVHEVPEGAWGAAGRTMTALGVAQVINPRLDPALRAQIADALARKGP